MADIHRGEILDDLPRLPAVIQGRIFNPSTPLHPNGDREVDVVITAHAASLVEGTYKALNGGQPYEIELYDATSLPAPDEE